MTINESRRHHYVPQFYLRRFGCVDDRHKVVVAERHRDSLVVGRKSISRIGYEEGLHDFVHGGLTSSVEGEINEKIETPFSNSQTWKKIESGQFAALNAADSGSIYGFARHLQLRNAATLRFMKSEHARYMLADDPQLEADFEWANFLLEERTSRGFRYRSARRSSEPSDTP